MILKLNSALKKNWPHIVIVTLVVLALATSYTLLNRSIESAYGNWRIVSSWGPRPERLARLDLDRGKIIAISQEGYLRAGRRGLDGIVSRNLFMKQEFTMKQNGTGHVFRLRLADPRKRVLLLVSDRYGETIVARRMKQH